MMLNKFVLLLILSAINVAELCSENNENLTKTIGSAIDLLTKAKSAVPSCSKEEKMDGAADCLDLYNRGFNTSGIYTIWPRSRLSRNRPLKVYCDMKRGGGGWTKITEKTLMGRYRNVFDQDWESFKKGFGDLEKSFHLGNDNIFMLTNQNLYQARVYRVIKRKMQYEYEYADCKFWIDDEYNNYTLHVSSCSGLLGKKLLNYDGMKFSTKDKDNDPNLYLNCAKIKKYGFWLTGCEKKNTFNYDIHLFGIKIRPWDFLFHESKPYLEKYSELVSSYT